MYAAQVAFTTGEISPDVSARIDLEQYKSALLLAENAVIRPYGAVARRQGSQFIGTAKYNDKPTRLFEFTAERNRSFLLEFGERYIRVWRNGIYTGIELETPFESELISKLNCIQSGDVMFVCSGKYPVKTISRYSDTNWKFDTYKLSEQPYDEINADINSTVSLDGDTLTSTKSVFNKNMAGMVMQIEHYVESQLATASGHVVDTSMYDYVTEFPDDDDNIYNNINYKIDSYSTDIELSWKFVTHGTWNGNVKLEISTNNEKTWKVYRSYNSKNDYNVIDTGKIPRNAKLRIKTELVGGSVSTDLSILPHTNYGVVEIKEVLSDKKAKVVVLRGVVKNEPTSKWKFGQWGKANGYPRVCTFYQDRFILASSPRFPNYIWFSRTGDYSNFGVEKVSGTITDDSAITLPVINRKMYGIRHLVPANDLLILTSGNEWIVDGSKTITPSNCNLRTQTQRGSSECEPQYIGNRCVYVQARGCVVRDMGYSYESDNYTGQDLTLFVKHLTTYRNFVTSAYAQDPDSIIYYVSDNGDIDCLTYIPEQKVYAWSHFKTNGFYTYAESVSEGEQDSLYVLVKRNINGGEKLCIERLEPMYRSDNDNIFMDCYSRLRSNDKHYEINVPHLVGKQVKIVVDRKERPSVVVPENGIVEIDGGGYDVAVGLSYVTRITIPPVESQLQDGTTLGRLTTMSRVALRLINSFGGRIGRDFKNMDAISLPPHGMFTGDKVCIIPKFANPYTTNTVVSIYHDQPYPFNVLSITREVEIGGGLQNAPGL